MTHTTFRPILLSVAMLATLFATPANARKPVDDDAYRSIASLTRAYQSGELDPRRMTYFYLQRIKAIDQAGPSLHSVIETNPDALVAAYREAFAYKMKKNGPLSGIPILLKDNIDTGDRMQTTAGSLALLGRPATRDATVTAKLRAAGAIILGKANLSEWANFRADDAINGWSARGGHTLNPYILDVDPQGSSTGSAVAVAAGLATVSIGTETYGSIISPALAAGIVAIKPTVGLVSRAGIIPVALSFDTPGPMARNLADAAALLGVIAGSDPRDPATAEADNHATDYTQFLDASALRGKRIGVVTETSESTSSQKAAVRKVIALLKAQGATVIEDVQLPGASSAAEYIFPVLLIEFKRDMAAYLATRTKQPLKTLADLITFNKKKAARELHLFGQGRFEVANDYPYDTRSPEYIETRDFVMQNAGPEGIDTALEADKLDALLGTDSGTAAMAGYPAITLPVDFTEALPAGVVFFGAKWSEPTLIEIAYGVEQKTQAFQRPTFVRTPPEA